MTTSSSQGSSKQGSSNVPLVPFIQPLGAGYKTTTASNTTWWSPGATDYTGPQPSYFPSEEIIISDFKAMKINECVDRINYLISLITCYDQILRDLVGRISKLEYERKVLEDLKK